MGVSKEMLNMRWMRKTIGLVSLGSILGLGSLALAERVALPQQQPVSLQFIASLFQMLQEVSPEQAEKDKDFDRSLRSLLTKAQSLQHDYHRAEQAGLRRENDRLALQKEGEVILDEALNQTEVYLQEVIKNLKDHRAEIKNKLLPQNKPQ